MKRKVVDRVMQAIMVLVVVLSVSRLGAETVLWYHFDDFAEGYVTTSADRFLNAADATSHVGIPFKQDAPSWPSVEAFPRDCSIYDPVSGAMFRNRTALRVQHQTSSGYQGSGVRIPDDESLHHENFTIEFLIAPCKVTNRQWGDFIFRNGFVQIYRAGEGNDWHWICVRDTVSGNREQRGGNSVWLTHGCNLVHVDAAHSNLWYHIALTADSVNKESKLYVNYSLVSTLPLYGKVDCSVAGDAYLGAYTANGGFDGYIDEFRLSNTVLGPSQFLRVCSPNALPETAYYCDYTSPTNFMWHWGTFRNNAPTVGQAGLAAQLVNASSACGVAADSVPGDMVRSGLLADADAQVPATAALHLVTNSADAAASSSSGYMTLRRTNSFRGSDATYETFFKAKRPSAVGDDRDCAMVFYSRTPYWYLCVWRSNGKLVIVKPGSSNGEDIGAVDDDAWHHLSVVFERGDATESYIAVYVDHAMCYRSTIATSVLSPSGDLGALYVGDCDWGAGYRFGDIHFGPMRVTLKALRPHEFLTTYPCEGDTLAWYSFEHGLLDNGTYTNMVSAGTAADFAGGTASFSAKVPGRELLDADGTKIRDNAASLAFAGGKVTYPRNSLIERQDVTMEFFAKQSSLSAGAGLVGVFRSPTGAAADISVESAIWSVRVGADGKTPEVYVNNGTGQTVAFPAAAALSSAWRHYAVSFRPDGNDTEVKLYVDGELAQTGAVSGLLQLPATTGGAIPVLGSAGGATGTPFNGFIDEVRLTAGAIDADDFLRVPSSGGLTIIFF